MLKMWQDERSHCVSRIPDPTVFIYKSKPGAQCEDGIAMRKRDHPCPCSLMQPDQIKEVTRKPLQDTGKQEEIPKGEEASSATKIASVLLCPRQPLYLWKNIQTGPTSIQIPSDKGCVREILLE
ncbi:hypothetical protein ANTRET_LOCUS98 [Anthophora retusa]